MGWQRFMIAWKLKLDWQGNFFNAPPSSRSLKRERERERESEGERGCGGEARREEGRMINDSGRRTRILRDEGEESLESRGIRSEEK